MIYLVRRRKLCSFRVIVGHGLLVMMSKVYSLLRGTFVLRVILIVLAVFPISYTGLHVVYMKGVVFLAALTLGYELCRNRLGSAKPESIFQRGLIASVYLLVSMGEPLRILVGYLRIWFFM